MVFPQPCFDNAYYRYISYQNVMGARLIAFDIPPLNDLILCMYGKPLNGEVPDVMPYIVTFHLDLHW